MMCGQGDVRARGGPEPHGVCTRKHVQAYLGRTGSTPARPRSQALAAGAQQHAAAAGRAAGESPRPGQACAHCLLEAERRSWIVIQEHAMHTLDVPHLVQERCGLAKHGGLVLYRGGSGWAAGRDGVGHVQSESA